MGIAPPIAEGIIRGGRGGAAAIYVAGCALCLTLFLLIAYLASRDHGAPATRISADRAAISQISHPFLMRPGYSAPIWGQTECLILYMIAADYPSRWHEAVAPAAPPLFGPSACTQLDDLLDGRAGPAWPYYRYLHGSRTVTALLLRVLPLSAIPWVLLAALCSLAGAIVLTAASRMVRDPSRANAGFLAIGLSLALFWGLPRFGTSIAFAFGDAIVLLMIMFFVVRDPLRMPERTFVLAFGLFGALTAYFEFMTGQTPMMMALIPGIIAVSSFGSVQAGLAWRRTALGLIAFLGMAAASIVGKWVLVVGVFGLDFLSELREKLVSLSAVTTDPELTGGARTLLMGLGLPVTYDGSLLHWLYWPFATFALSSPAIGLGSFFLGTAIICGSVLVTAFALCAGWTRMSCPMARARIGMLALSLTLLVAWYAIFHSHLLYHGSFMVRPLAWLPALAAVACLNLLEEPITS
jgi:hypothetical protein